MSTRLIKPARERRLDIRCTVGDAVIGNLAITFVFFFKRRLDADALAKAAAEVLVHHPMYAARMAAVDGRIRIRCAGQGMPFTVKSSKRTLKDALRSTVEDRAHWLADVVDGFKARLGWTPPFTVRVTHLADGATAIGCSWHHPIGDLQTIMLFLKAWAAAAAGEPIVEPLLVEDRVAYLDEHLPPDGARTPGVRHLGLGEFAKAALYLAKDARKQRTVSLYFGEEEIRRMREAYGTRTRLSANDVLCAHLSEALVLSEPTMDQRTLVMAVNVRKRFGLDPRLLGNMFTMLQLPVHRGEPPSAIAERVRHAVDHFGDEHCDMRQNQRFMDASSSLDAVRCVSTAFDVTRWPLVMSNHGNFDVYGLRFEDTTPSFYAPLMIFPVAGLGALSDGVDGRGALFTMAVPPKVAEAMTSEEMQERLHQFRRTTDDIPVVHRDLHGGVSSPSVRRSA